jgi:hypothetical protein
MVADVGYHVEAQPAVGGDRFVQPGVGKLYERLEIRALSAGTQSDPRPVALRRDMPDEDVDAQVHPWAVEGLLDGGDDARLSGPRGTVKDDDLAEMG